MKSNSWLGWLAAGVLALLSPGSIRGQQVADVRVLDVRPADSGIVQVLATVTDSGGRRVDGLGAANFAAIVGAYRAMPDVVERVSDGGVPMSIILLLDTSGSMNHSVAALRDAASAFVERLAPADACSLMTFGDGVKTIASFTTDKNQLLSLLRNLQARENKTYLYQALDDALNRAGVAPSARSAIVLLTDGHDEGSAVTAEDVFKKIDQVRVPIYTVGFGGNADTALLRRLAALSHGTSFDAPTDAELKQTYLAILDQLKSAYRLRFSFKSLHSGSHTLDLMVSLRGSSATSRVEFSAGNTNGPETMGNFPWVWIIPVVVALGSVGAWSAWKRLHTKGVPRSDDSDLMKTVVPPKVWLDVVEGVHTGEKLLLFDDSSSIGRDPKTCQVCLERDPLVGRVHARVFRDGSSQYVLEDLGSQNGTRVNDVAIREAVVLQSGDTISIGTSRLRFTDNR